MSSFPQPESKRDLLPLILEAQFQPESKTDLAPEYSHQPVSNELFLLPLDSFDEVLEAYLSGNTNLLQPKKKKRGLFSCVKSKKSQPDRLLQEMSLFVDFGSQPFNVSSPVHMHLLQTVLFNIAQIQPEEIKLKKPVPQLTQCPGYSAPLEQVLQQPCALLALFGLLFLLKLPGNSFQVVQHCSTNLSAPFPLLIASIEVAELLVQMCRNNKNHLFREASPLGVFEYFVGMLICWANIYSEKELNTLTATRATKELCRQIKKDPRRVRPSFSG